MVLFVYGLAGISFVVALVALISAIFDHSSGSGLGAAFGMTFGAGVILLVIAYALDKLRRIEEYLRPVPKID